MKRILSGVQPTGNLHLGNYLGAIKNWVDLQDHYESFFCVVDLHAITLPQEASHLRLHTLETTAIYLAAGINPEKSTVFIQSTVPSHAELMWILACSTPLGWLNRMTQFKDKAGKSQEKQNLGLYAYPVLMAADILLYQANYVPVGDDQKQHLELTRDLAQLFNRTYKTELFVIPEPKIFGAATRIMSLKDGAHKMSKSDPAEGSRLNLLDAPDIIYHKIKKAKTDAGLFPDSPLGLDSRPEIRNLLNIYSALSDVNETDICNEFGGKNFSEFKEKLATLCVESLSPLRVKFLDLMKNKDHLEKILERGSQKANQMAQETLGQVKNLIGLG